MRAIKLVISGPFNAGKSRFVETASEIAPVQTERRVSDHWPALKPTTTAALDYGRLTIAGRAVLHLYGTPGQRRFDFMWEALARGMRGLLVVVDSTDRHSFGEARHILGFFGALATVPCVIAANKQDQPGALEPEALAEALALPSTTVVLPCVATEPTSVRATLIALLDLLPAQLAAAAEVAARPIVPRGRAPLALVAWPGGLAHLTPGGGTTLCGRAIPTAALPVLVAGGAVCRACAAAATRAGLRCADCGRTLTRSDDGTRCLGCAAARRSGPSDALAWTPELL